MLDYILEKRAAGETLSRDELIHLLGFPPDSHENYRIMSLARRITRDVSQGQGEIHAQFALNLAPCPKNCKFCSFAMVNGVFDTPFEISLEEALSASKKLEEDGANAVFIMSTANYDPGKFLEFSSEIRRDLKDSTVMIANVGDAPLSYALKLKDAGFTGVYHALRLREGKDTAIKPEIRRRSIETFKDAGLVVGTCVEPVGPEHSDEELADMILYTASIEPAYSGAARRIPIPGGVMEPLGMISELRMAQIVAVTRFGMPDSVKGNCTHEPCTLGIMGGANLFWAEMGANPRDTKENTEEGRGHNVDLIRKISREAELSLLDGPSRFYRR